MKTRSVTETMVLDDLQNAIHAGRPVLYQIGEENSTLEGNGALGVVWNLLSNISFVGFAKTIPQSLVLSPFYQPGVQVWEWRITAEPFSPKSLLRVLVQI